MEHHEPAEPHDVDSAEGSSAAPAGDTNEDSGQQSTVHTPRHQDERPHKCPHKDCKYYTQGFTTIFPRDRHMTTHQNERPHKCLHKTCEYSIQGFTRLDALNVHMRAHQDERPYKCPHKNCKYYAQGFKSVAVLKRHLKTHRQEQHEAERSAKCPVGLFDYNEKGFADKNLLKEQPEKQTWGCANHDATTWARAEEGLQHAEQSSHTTLETQHSEAQNLNQSFWEDYDATTWERAEEDLHTRVAKQSNPTNPETHQFQLETLRSSPSCRTRVITILHELLPKMAFGM